MSQKRKSYALEDKLKAVKMAKGSNNVKAAAHFEVYESTIRKWRLNEAKLKADKNTHGGNGKRLKGGGRRVRDKEFDDNLARWVRKLRGNKLRVSRKMVQNEARKQLGKYAVEGDEGKPQRQALDGCGLPARLPDLPDYLPHYYYLPEIT